MSASWNSRVGVWVFSNPPPYSSPAKGEEFFVVTNKPLRYNQLPARLMGEAGWELEAAINRILSEWEDSVEK